MIYETSINLTSPQENAGPAIFVGEVPPHRDVMLDCSTRSGSLVGLIHRLYRHMQGLLRMCRAWGFRT